MDRSPAHSRRRRVEREMLIDRLAEQHVSQAYEQLVPIRRYPIGTQSPQRQLELWERIRVPQRLARG